MVTDERNTDILRCMTYRPINLATELLHSRRWSRGFYILLSFTFFTFLKKCADYLAMWIFVQTHILRAYYSDYFTKYQRVSKNTFSYFYLFFTGCIYSITHYLPPPSFDRGDLVIYIGDIQSTRLYTEYRRCMFSRI